MAGTGDDLNQAQKDAAMREVRTQMETREQLQALPQDSLLDLISRLLAVQEIKPGALPVGNQTEREAAQQKITQNAREQRDTLTQTIVPLLVEAAAKPDGKDLHTALVEMAEAKIADLHNKEKAHRTQSFTPHNSPLGFVLRAHDIRHPASRIPAAEAVNIPAVENYRENQKQYSLLVQQAFSSLGENEKRPRMADFIARAEAALEARKSPDAFSPSYISARRSLEAANLSYGQLAVKIDEVIGKVYTPPEHDADKKTRQRYEDCLASINGHLTKSLSVNEPLPPLPPAPTPLAANIAQAAAAIISTPIQEPAPQPEKPAATPKPTQAEAERLIKELVDKHSIEAMVKLVHRHDAALRGAMVESHMASKGYTNPKEYEQYREGSKDTAAHVEKEAARGLSNIGIFGTVSEPKRDMLRELKRAENEAKIVLGQASIAPANEVDRTFDALFESSPSAYPSIVVHSTLTGAYKQCNGDEAKQRGVIDALKRGLGENTPGIQREMKPEVQPAATAPTQSVRPAQPAPSAPVTSPQPAAETPREAFERSVDALTKRLNTATGSGTSSLTTNHGVNVAVHRALVEAKMGEAGYSAAQYQDHRHNATVLGETGKKTDAYLKSLTGAALNDKEKMLASLYQAEQSAFGTIGRAGNPTDPQRIKDYLMRSYDGCTTDQQHTQVEAAMQRVQKELDLKPEPRVVVQPAPQQPVSAQPAAVQPTPEEIAAKAKADEETARKNFTAKMADLVDGASAKQRDGSLVIASTHGKALTDTRVEIMMRGEGHKPDAYKDYIGKTGLDFDARKPNALKALTDYQATTNRISLTPGSDDVKKQLMQSWEKASPEARVEMQKSVETAQARISAPKQETVAAKTPEKPAAAPAVKAPVVEAPLVAAKTAPVQPEAPKVDDAKMKNAVSMLKSLDYYTSNNGRFSGKGVDGKIDGYDIGTLTATGYYSNAEERRTLLKSAMDLNRDGKTTEKEIRNVIDKSGLAFDNSERGKQTLVDAIKPDAEPKPAVAVPQPAQGAATQPAAAPKVNSGTEIMQSAGKAPDYINMRDSMAGITGVSHQPTGGTVLLKNTAQIQGNLLNVQPANKTVIVPLNQQELDKLQVKQENGVTTLTVDQRQIVIQGTNVAVALHGPGGQDQLTHQMSAEAFKAEKDKATRHAAMQLGQKPDGISGGQNVAGITGMQVAAVGAKPTHSGPSAGV